MIKATEMAQKAEIRKAQLVAEKEKTRIEYECKMLKKYEKLLSDSINYIEKLIIEQTEKGSKNCELLSPLQLINSVNHLNNETEWNVMHTEPWGLYDFYIGKDSWRNIEFIFDKVLQIFEANGFRISGEAGSCTKISW